MMREHESEQPETAPCPTCGGTRKVWMVNPKSGPVERPCPRCCPDATADLSDEPEITAEDIETLYANPDAPLSRARSNMLIAKSLLILAILVIGGVTLLALLGLGGTSTDLSDPPPSIEELDSSSSE